MDAQIKEKWVAALRSGDYKQGKGALQRCNEFCCLGVLCDVVKPDGWEEMNKQTLYVSFSFAGYEEECSLPDTLQRELGITDEQASELMDMNDNLGQDFSDIADYIEKNM